MTGATCRADTVAVIGAAAGIGAAAAGRLTSAGRRVIRVDVRDADITCDLEIQAGRRVAVDRVSQVAHDVLDGLVVIAGGNPGGETNRTGAAVLARTYFGSVALLEGLRPALARSGHAAVVVATMESEMFSRWPRELERLCLVGDEDQARKLAGRIDEESGLAASRVALARYVRRRSFAPEWLGAAIRLSMVAPARVATGDIRHEPDSRRAYSEGAVRAPPARSGDVTSETPQSGGAAGAHLLIPGMR
jgi:NAD(P)-dependent dehydrogenase (short-subunit alcohol dehydrogenase family)